MNVNVRQRDDVTILDLKGKITIGSGDVALRNAVQEVISSGTTKVLINMKDVTTIDSSGIVEMVHACSLVLDDLPAMDDAALRRGRPTVHRVFGESVALLAALALLNRAYALVAEAANRLSVRRYTGEDMVH